MTRLATLETIVVAAWLGAAILVAAAVAPAAFRVLPSRTLAGALVGEVLPVVFIGGIVVGVFGAVLEMRSAADSARLKTVAPFIVVILACLVAQFVIGPRIEAVRATISGAVDALDASDPRRVQFGRLHGFSVLWMGVAMLAAAWSLLTKLLSNNS
jgi:fructose-specific phosphotransferase system IIC component